MKTRRRGEAEKNVETPLAGAHVYAATDQCTIILHRHLGITASKGTAERMERTATKTYRPRILAIRRRLNNRVEYCMGEPCARLLRVKIE